jgi:hypothetical protein
MSIVPATGTSIATADDPYALDPVWYSLDDHLNSFEVHRGRPDEFNDTEAGEATVTFLNRDGLFDATNTAGALYGNLLALRQFKINVQHPWAGTYHDVFTGYIEKWDYSRSGPRGAAAVATAVDMLALLAQADVNTTRRGAPYAASYAAAHWDDRIKAALADAGVPADYMQIATGNINCQAQLYDAGSKVLEVVRDAVDAEFPLVSNFFATASGIARASGRFIRGVDGTDPSVVYPSLVSKWRVGDAYSVAQDPTLLPIYDLQWERATELLMNSIVCTPTGVDAADIAGNYVSSGLSINKYGLHGKEILDLLILDADIHTGQSVANTGLQECETFARYLLSAYGDPHDRISSIVFHGQMDDGTTTPGWDPLNASAAPGKLWDFILGVEINHILEVNTKNPPGGNADYSPAQTGGGFSAREFYVEGIHHVVRRQNGKIANWEMQLDLSPRSLGDPWDPDSWQVP